MTEEAVKKLAKSLDSLEFVVHKGKSVLEPTKKIFGYFLLDSLEMMVYANQEKIQKFWKAGWSLL